MDLIDLAIWGQLVADSKHVETHEWLWLGQLGQIELDQIVDEPFAAGLEDLDVAPGFFEERITIVYIIFIVVFLLHIVIVLSYLFLNRFRLKKVEERQGRSDIFFGNEFLICQSDQTAPKLIKAYEKLLCKVCV